jgi:hypothetical protein
VTVSLADAVGLGDGLGLTLALVPCGVGAGPRIVALGRLALLDAIAAASDALCEPDGPAGDR